jgi:hypothetical protein
VGDGRRRRQDQGGPRDQRVEQGAKQIGLGEVGLEFREMFSVIGHTVVEGAKFSGENMKELFTGKK